MQKKTKNILINVSIAVLVLVFLLPSSRAWIQQGLMKVGLFKPNLEIPVDSSNQSAPIHTKPVPAVKFYNAAQEEVNIAELKGKVVFLNFWATWCPPCIAEMPSIDVLFKKFKDREDVVFLIVEIEGEEAKAATFVKDKKLSLPIYFPTGNIPETWLGGSIPTTVILDKEGAIAARHEGMADYSTKEVFDFIDDLTKK